jgi:transposase
VEINVNYQPETLAEANQIIVLLKDNLQIQHDQIQTQYNQIQMQQEKISTIEQQYENLHHQLTNLLRGKYGKRSEKLPEGYCQLSLFGETKEGVKSKIAGEEFKPELETVTYTRKKRNGHRNIPDDLPRVRIEYKLEDLTCPCGCGNKLHKIAEVVTEQLEIVPAKIYVIQHVRFKYAGCIHENQVVTAPMPNQPIDKGWAGPGLLADVLVNKYDDHLPLYRQSERLARHGIDIARQTLCDWVMQCADLLQPIVEAMKPDLLASPKLHTDDTVIPVQEEGRDKTKEGRLWVYLGYKTVIPDEKALKASSKLGLSKTGIDTPTEIVGCEKPCAIFDYSPDRQQKWAEGFLKNYKGYLQADAYTGYDHLFKSKNIIEVVCMAHARRKFFEVAKASDVPGIATTALAYIRELYKIERQAKNLSPMGKKAFRKRKAKPILKQYKKWLLAQQARVLPKSPLGIAVTYSLNNWSALTRYLGNGILDIDNNKAERLMRPIAVGRKNWGQTGSDRGGVAAAVIYSLIETCKLNKINPYDYLRDVLARLPNTLNRDIQSLFPYNWKPQTF